MKQLRVGVIYGGRSGEHEVSVASAASIFKHLDRSRYEPIPIRIEKDGRWTLADKAPASISAADVIEHARLESARPVRPGREAHLVAHPSEDTVLSIERPAPATSELDPGTATVTGVGLDVIFPVLHGPYGEDGTVQGLLELANVPYVGAGVLGSAVGMDKAVMKTLFMAHMLPVGTYLVVRRREWNADANGIAARVTKELRFPVFVKPANLGSSVGISKAKSEDDLRAAIELALQFDRKIVIEAAIPNAREIECSVLGNDDPQASVPGEVIPGREFYDYEAKYLDDTSRVVIPADLTDAQVREVQRLAIAAFRAVDCAGMARVDSFIDASSGKIYVNEVNTIPGFTTISMYPKMWEASGVSYSELIDRLITLALERHAEKQQLRTSVT
ncbi:MAG: D-alanine--D-alanine ligase A [Acidobacteria bacterium]|nr:MAG: D-alanine--D-alanine ligase A [Acidobacteriota bacterium]